MASTKPGTAAPQAEPGRLTARQRRIEEQRRKIETMRAQQRRKRLTWGGLILLALAIVVAASLLFFQRPSAGPAVALPEKQYPSEGRDHVPTGSPLNYKNRPPSSGPHYDTPAGYQFYTRPAEPGNWVHTLEHGGVVLLYQPDLCDQACVSQLQQVYGTVPTDGKYNLKKMTVTAYQNMDHKLAVVAWQWVMELDDVNQDQIIAFYREHVDRGPEDIP